MKKSKFKQEAFEPIFAKTTKILPALDFTEDNVYINMWIDSRGLESDDITIKPYWLSDNTLLKYEEVLNRGLVFLSRTEIIKDRISNILLMMLIAKKLDFPIDELKEIDNCLYSTTTNFALPTSTKVETSRETDKCRGLLNLSHLLNDLWQKEAQNEVSVECRDKNSMCILSLSLYNIIKTISHKTSLPTSTNTSKVLLDVEDEFVKECNNLFPSYFALPSSTSLPILKILFELIKNKFDFYFELSDTFVSSFLSLWIIGTYFFPLFRTYCYIYLYGVKRSGKSNVLSILEKICFNGRYASEITTSTIYRMISATQCTLLIDETDDLASTKYKGELINILRNGYKNGVLIPRQFQRSERTGDMSTVYFNAYCPKALANITGLEDVLEDRTIRITMQRAVNPVYSERCEYIDADDTWIFLRDMLYLNLLYNWRDIKLSYLTMQKPEGIMNRDWELWRPILSIAKLIGEDVYNQMIEYAGVKIKQKISDEFVDVRDNLLAQALFELVNKDGWYKLGEIRQSYLNQSEDLDPARTFSSTISKLLVKLGYQNKRLVGGKTEFYLRKSQVETDLTKRFKSSIRWLRLSVSFYDLLNFVTENVSENEKSMAELENQFCEKFNVELGSKEIEILWEIVNKLKEIKSIGTCENDKIKIVASPTEEQITEISNSYKIILNEKLDKKSLKSTIDELVVDEIDIDDLKKKLLDRGFETEPIEKTMQKMLNEGELTTPTLKTIKKAF